MYEDETTSINPKVTIHKLSVNTGTRHCLAIASCGWQVDDWRSPVNGERQFLEANWAFLGPSLNWTEFCYF